eukprot:TRINITY_DN1493_c0_g1_i12.p1 TRINITY_DN1493_c0_g1~~TRINITY_DN1493_c0_g1_i12.p1  ORF type:complete len:1556 (+),score=196.48 TRINITY_DN1493_c0_g1_i12:647-4669(+)
MAPFSFCHPTLSGTLINIGRNFFAGTEKYVQQAQGRGFFGEIDEISLWNKTLSAQEVSDMYTTKLRGDEYGLLTYYDMNDGSGTVAKNLAFTGSAYDLHLGQGVRAHVYLDATSNSIYELTVPTFAPSHIPLTVDQSDGTSFHPRIIMSIPHANVSTLLTFNLTGHSDVSYIEIFNAPTYGTLYQSADGITQGTIISSFPAQLDGPYLFYKVPSSPLWDADFDGFDEFHYHLFDVSDTLLTDGIINCIPNLVPYSTNKTLTAQSGLTLFTSPATIDSRGGKLKWRTISVPEHGNIYQTAADGSLSTEVAVGDYLTHHGGFFGYQPPTIGGGAGLDNFVYIAEDEDGVQSAPYAFIFNVNPFNFKPDTVDQEIGVDENDRIYINLESIDKDGQLVATSISKLPSHGKLFIANPDDTLGAEITKVANPYDGVTVKSSYANAVTGISSFWGDGQSYDYTPWEILGKQDVTKYGDSPRTWCPLTLTGDDKFENFSMNGLNFSWNPATAYTKFGYTEYIELAFDHEVYAFSVEVGMCRGMGSLVNVKAKSPEGWKSLWSQPASTQILQTAAATKSYYTYQISLCETTYKTNSLRLEYNTRDVGDWAETDYVYFVGTTDLRPAVFEWNHTRVVYIPDKNYFGADTFEFLANDCPFSGLRDSNPGTVNITVRKIDVPPICEPVQSTATLGKDIYIHLQNSSEEVNGGVITKYSILTLPKYGKLYSVDDEFEITDVPTNVSGGTLRFNTDYWQWEGSVKITFVYTVYAVLASSENSTVSIELHIPATENAAIAWIMLLVLLFLTVPAYPLLMTRHNTYPLRTTSYVLNMVATTGALLFANIPLQLIAFSDYPCWFYYFSYMLAPPIFATPILVGLYRHHYIYQLNKLKRRIAKADKASSISTRFGEPHHRHRGPTSEDLESVAYFRKLTSEGRLLILTVIGCLIPFILAFALMPAADGTFGYTYCHMGNVVQVCFLVYWLLYTGAIAAGLYFVRNDHELTGFRRHIFYTGLTALFVGLLYLIVYGVMPPSARYASFGLLFVIIPCVYQFLAISRPAVQTFPLLRKPTKSREEEGGEPLSEVIITSKGFAWYLEFTMAEFSQESPLAWKAIQNFKSKTSYEAMRDIFTKYFAEGSPLLVNLAASSLRELRVVVERTTQQTPMNQLQTIYDVVQMELMELMQQDSYMRFIASDYYQRYKRNEAVPRSDQHTTTSSNPKDDYESIAPFAKPGLNFGGVKSSSPDTSTHEHDPLATSSGGESKIEVSSIGDRESMDRRDTQDKLTIQISGLSRPESPNGGSSTPSASSIAEPSALFGVEMTSRASDAHPDRHETVLEEPDVEDSDQDQGQVL